jgi:5'(3')-deoxyribonucleotidase
MARYEGGDHIVLVDMDGVVADYEERNNEIIREHFPDVPIVENRAEFYFEDTYEQYSGVADTLYDAIRKPGFFRSFPVVEGAIDGFAHMLESGIQPVICSSPAKDHPTVVSEKKGWLEEHFVPVFGWWVLDMAIFDRDKSAYDAFAAIDDRPTMRNSRWARWQHVVFSQPYNASVDAKYRLNGWNDPHLDEVLSHARLDYLDKKYQGRS